MGFDFVGAVSILIGLVSLLIFLIPFYGLVEVYGISSSARNVGADSLNSRKSYDAFYKYKEVVPFSMKIKHKKPQIHIPLKREKMHYDLDFSSLSFNQFPIDSSYILTKPHSWGNDTWKNKTSEFRILNTNNQ